MLETFLLCVYLEKANVQCPYGGFDHGHFIEAPIREWENDDGYVEWWSSQAQEWTPRIQPGKVPRPCARPQEFKSKRGHCKGHVGR